MATRITFPKESAVQALTAMMGSLLQSVDELEAIVEEIQNNPVGGSDENFTAELRDKLDALPLLSTLNDILSGKVDAEEGYRLLSVDEAGIINSFPDDLAGVINTQIEAVKGVELAPLGPDGIVPVAYLPSTLEEIKSYDNVAAFPAIGEDNKLYVDRSNSNKQYRWDGEVYIPLPDSPGTTDDVPEGGIRKYFTEARVLATALQGLNTTTNRAITPTDSFLVAAGLLQKQITDALTTIAGILTTQGSQGTAIGQKVNTVDVVNSLTTTIAGKVADARTVASLNTALTNFSNAVTAFVNLFPSPVGNDGKMLVSAGTTWTAITPPTGGGGGTAAPPTTQTITSGSSVTMTSSTSTRHRIQVDPITALPNLTITLPANPPADGHVVEIYAGGQIVSGVVVTNLTINPNTGQSIIQPSVPTNLEYADAVEYEWVLSTSKWRRK